MTETPSFNVESLVSKWIEYWNSHDAEGAHGLFDDQFEFYSPFLKGKAGYPDGKIRNKKELKSYFKKIIQSIPDLQLQVKNIETEKNSVNLHFYSASENLMAKGAILFNDQGKIKQSKFEFKKDTTFANRTGKLPKSFIREILKVTNQPEIISFAGGLPNPEFFPVDGIRKAANKVLQEDGASVLQYSTSEGYQPLREYIAKRYKQKKGIKVNPDCVIVTNGSQQDLDLTAKLFIDKGNRILLEKPSYLGAIQAFSVFEPVFQMTQMLEDGPDIQQLQLNLNSFQPKLFYAVPNFQNPSGITYSLEKRKQTAKLLYETGCWLIEDDPYGEIRFMGKDLPPVASFMPEKSIMCGSFSKIVAPGLRLGWLVAPENIISKITTLKQATDLHSNYFSQRVLYQYLQDNNIDEHIHLIKQAYRKQRNLMLKAIDQFFPEEVKVTRPEGGMFLWATLPEWMDSIEIFKISLEKKVAFVPGRPFYTGNYGNNTIRLNFSNAQPEKIEEGIKRLADALKFKLAHK